jgi:hypothetical protein
MRNHRNHLACRIREYCREVAAAWGDLATFAEINRKYSLDMAFDSPPRLCERIGLTFPPL